MVLRARSAGPCSEMPVPGSLSAGRISTISQSIPARLSATPRLMPAMPAPTISTLCAAPMGTRLPEAIETGRPPRAHNAAAARTRQGHSGRRPCDHASRPRRRVPPLWRTADAAHSFGPPPIIGRVAKTPAGGGASRQGGRPMTRFFATRRDVLAGGSAALALGLGATLAPRAARADMTPHEKELYEAAKKEGELTWYTSHSDDVTAHALGRKFEQLYPGIKCNVVRTTAQVAFQRVTQELKAG